MTDTSIGPGSVLAGRFVLEDLLDESEGAKFWRATDKVLARNVAVHVIALRRCPRRGLLSAARTSATVTDGHLLRVLDAATQDGYTYVVNEWGNGMSLDRILAEGPLRPAAPPGSPRRSPRRSATAHRHGIAHGRLLPENVMVTEAGSVKLIGFVIDAVLRGRGAVRVTGGQPLGEHEADVVNLAGTALRRPGRPLARHRGLDLPDAPDRAGAADAPAAGPRRRAPPPRRDLRTGAEPRRPPPGGADRDRARGVRRPLRLRRRPHRRHAARRAAPTSSTTRS